MAKKFLDRYKKSEGVSSSKKSKSISFDGDVLEGLEHNAKLLKVSVSEIVNDAVREVKAHVKLPENKENN